MTNPRPDAQEPREGMRASPDLPVLPPSPISPVYESSSSRQTSPSPSIDDSRAGTPVSDLSVSDSSDNDQVAPSCSPDTYQRGGRRGFSADQLCVIGNYYEGTPYPSREQYQQLASTLSVDSKTIKLWFQNRRCKARKQLTRQEREPEASRVSSDDDDVKYTTGSSRTKTNQDDVKPQTDVADVKPVMLAPIDKTSGPEQYKEMTTMSLPADHPFCQLLPAGPLSRRARRPAARPRPSSDSPVARPPNARGRSKKALHKMDTPLLVASVAPPAAIVVKPEPARIWRPIDDPRSASGPSPPQQVPVKQERPPSASSPLDLSVSLKRKRDGTDAAIPSAIDTSGKKRAGEMSGLHPAALPAGYPMMYPSAFPYYGHPAGGAYMPVMPQMAFPMPHLPMGLYGQSVSMWGGAMPGMPRPQKSVR